MVILLQKKIPPQTPDRGLLKSLIDINKNVIFEVNNPACSKFKSKCESPL